LTEDIKKPGIYSTMLLKELADRIGGLISGDSGIEITGVSGLKDARAGDITFLSAKINVNDAVRTAASALIVNPAMKELVSREKDTPITMLVVDHPQLAFAKALEIFNPNPYVSAGISDRAVIGKNISTGDDVSIYPLAYICDNVSLGARVTISSGVYIGEGVTIGDDSIIDPNVTIREKTRIGKKVIIHSGTVIGSDGFGYVLEKGTHHKIPQTGGVIIEDDVEIGANVTVDRATIGDTVIGKGTKIDNLVQIGHNVKIGTNCIIVSQVGISGSVEIGDGVVLAGQVGIRDHVKIGNGAIVGSQSGIGSNVPDGQVFSGSPAIPHKTWLRAQSIYAKLPEYIRRLQGIERKLEKEDHPDDEQ
jgi:UDP-3-O-[3-hydroxymyristoyl] glucosamine N-acyltransferase